MANDPGVLIIVTSPDGVVVAAEADFETDSHSDAQTARAKNKAWDTAMRYHVSFQVYEVIGRRPMLRDMIREGLINDGWRETKMEIGHAG